MNGTKKVKFGMAMKLVLLAILPVTLVTAIVFFIASSSLKEGMQSEALIGLADLANSVSASYDIMDDGEWHMEADGLYKGDINLSADMTLFDKFVANSEADVTIFWGDTRQVTSLRDKDTNERIIGTQATQAVIDTVIKGGQDYQSTNVQVNAQPYYAYYIPITDSNNQVVGMVFAGKPSEEIDSYISASLMKVTGVACVLIVASVIVGIFIGRMIASGIKEAERVIQSLENGTN